MANREELYRQFGPQLIEAIVKVIKNEINILRVIANKPERTNQQIMGAVSNELNNTPIYDWMENQE
jgi:hypothetical protein